MDRKKDIRNFRDLEVYRRAFAAAMEIFQVTKDFPADEEFSLVDQIRRASRSQFDKLDNEYEEIISMLNSMKMNAQKFCF